MMTAVAGGIYGIDNKKLQLISEENKTIITKNLLLFTFNLKPKIISLIMKVEKLLK